MLKKVCSLALCLGLLTGVCGGAADSARPDAHVTVRFPSGDASPFEGWGTSLCWWANRIGYSDTLSQKAALLFFSDMGLRMNIMRYNIGGGDDPAHRHITRTDSEVPGWTVWNEDTQSAVFDPEADHDQVNVLVRCFAAAGEEALVEVFSNSPPWYMTVSGCSSGSHGGRTDNLRKDACDQFADYLARVTACLRDRYGIRIASLSPMNEPDTDYWQAYSPKQEGCHFDPGQSQSRIIVACAAALEKYGLSEVILAASDETDTGKQLNEYARYSPEAKALIGRINTHTYGENRMRDLGRLAKKEGVPLWMSEVDGGNTAGTNAGEMGAAIWLGQKIIRDLTALEPSAWVLWQVIDSHISSAGRNGNRDTGMVNTLGGFWGTAVADHDRQEIILTQKYYGLGQFTRFIRPGMVLIPCDENTLAAYDSAEGAFAIVSVNPLDRERRVEFRLPAEIAGSVRQIRTSGPMAGGEHWAVPASLTPDGDRFTADLKANSITTFLLRCTGND